LRTERKVLVTYDLKVGPGLRDELTTGQALTTSCTQGSTIGRHTASANPSAIRKDVNFLEDGRVIQLGEQRDAFLSQLRKVSQAIGLVSIFAVLSSAWLAEQDTAFLTSLNVMDYSLLIAFLEPNAEEPGFEGADKYQMGKGKDSIRVKRLGSQNGFAMALAGIVDFLQDYNMKKRAARLLKVSVLKQDPTALSTVPPRQYGERFLSFIEARTVV
jgi:hypothetical protein